MSAKEIIKTRIGITVAGRDFKIGVPDLAFTGIAAGISFCTLPAIADPGVKALVSAETALVTLAAYEMTRWAGNRLLIKPAVQKVLPELKALAASGVSPQEAIQKASRSYQRATIAMIGKIFFVGFATYAAAIAAFNVAHQKLSDDAVKHVTASHPVPLQKISAVKVQPGGVS